MKKPLLVFVVCAGSLHHALEELPASLRNQLVEGYLAIHGLNFNPIAVNPRKTVPYYFQSFLHYHSNIVIWHDVVNNSINNKAITSTFCPKVHL